jgi:sortase A
MSPSYLLNRFFDRLSTMLLLFGIGLLVIGIAIQVSRHLRMRSVVSSAQPPSFEELLRGATPMTEGGRLVAPVLSDDAGHHPGMMPARLEIPSVGIDTEVTSVGWQARIVNGDKQGNVWETADYMAGFHENSAPPGTVGNTVISGHNNKRGEVFRDLYKVKPGDLVYIENEAGDRFVYEVEESFVLKEEGATEQERFDNTHWIRQTPDERLTLVTCFPPWSNSHRWIVVAFPLPPGETTDDLEGMRSEP